MLELSRLEQKIEIIVKKLFYHDKVLSHFKKGRNNDLVVTFDQFWNLKC
jgi:hypothetical protein